MAADPDPDLTARLEYLDLTKDELLLLSELRPMLLAEAEELVAAFYLRLLSFEPTRRLLRDPELRDRLLEKQRAYLLSLAGPTLDAQFVRERRQIGEVHERIGLEPRYYLGAYALYLSLLTPLVCRAFAGDQPRAERTLIALQKLLLLDAQLAMEAYIRRREQELGFGRAELERSSRELSSAYETQRLALRETAERARAAEELASIGTLVAGLAHEIGTPMGVIRGHAKKLETAVRGKDARWRLQTIQEQIGRISNIIQTLLNMARPGKARRQPVALEPLLENTFFFLSEKFKNHGITARPHFEPAPSVEGDPERLQQLFLNLFLNAADAMPNGGELRVSLASTPDGVEVRVADTGSGIAERDLSRVFDPFFTSKPAGQGNGLGLTVAKSIVTDHGGTIGVSSEAGQGTEFRICFPVAGGDVP
jgi:signal transduction histidine kinase